MIVVVNDANVLIDLVKLDLVSQFFELPLVFHTTDFILEELHTEQRECLTPFIQSGTFKILSLSAEDLIEINILQAEKAQLSIQDCSAIVCSNNINGSLITSDNNLRKFATTKNVTVRGHLWVFDQLVEHGKLSPKEAIVKLTELNTKVNVRLNLPKVECDLRIKKWENS
jgi:predicted nucleic acid-binding protein